MSFWPVGCFADKQVLVSGGTSGIGAGIAAAFVAEGAAVTVTGVSEAEVDAARATNPDVTGLVLDVRDSDTVRAVIDGMDRLDHLVNCAGIIRRGDELEADVFADVVDINLNGSMRTCSIARKKLAASRGTIVNTASMLSFFGGSLVPGYAASKGGVVQMTKSLAIAYADDGIRVNAIAPGWIDTPLTKALQENEERSQALMARTPLKRWGKPEDLAGAVLFLSSPLAGFITGAVLTVDGGYSVV
ncbi:MAG: SDR family oxidoreductase [Gammaproteobacteria bacterium]|nr:SDR family oxidoreductase [Gammaproteobacteria bacterium]